MKKLYPFQKQAFDCLVRVVGTRSGAYIAMATGLGKTVVAAHFVRWWKKHRGTPILFISHMWEASDQAMAEFRETLGSKANFQIFVGTEQLNPQADVVFTTFQTMRRRFSKIPFDMFGLIMNDEAHHAPADTYRPTLEHFKPDFLFGMTATDRRMDGRLLDDLFGEPVFEYRLAQAIANHDLADIEYRVLTDNVSEAAMRAIIKRLNQGDRLVTRAMIDREIFLTERMDSIHRQIREARQARKRTIIFCNSRKHARAVHEWFPEAGLFYSGLPSPGDTLVEFKNGEIATLIVVNKANEVVDIPDADLIVFLRATESRTIWMQQLGRGLRKTNDKKSVLVLDFVANCDRLYDVAMLASEIKTHLRCADDRPEFRRAGLEFHFAVEAREIIGILERLERNFYPTLEEFKAAVLAAGIRNCKEYEKRYIGNPRFPSRPNEFYPDWQGWGEIFGPRRNFYPTMEEFKAAVLAAGIRSENEYQKRRSENQKFPSNPYQVYPDWKGWDDIFDRLQRNFFPTKKEFKVAVLAAGIRSIKELREYKRQHPEGHRFPSCPWNVYTDWRGWSDIVGPRWNFYPTLEEFKTAVLADGIWNCREYQKRRKKNQKFPSYPPSFYPDWTGWGEIFGNPPRNFYQTMKEFKAAVLAAGIKSSTEYKKRRRENPKFPSYPPSFYPDWRGWPWVFGKKPDGRSRSR